MLKDNTITVYKDNKSIDIYEHDIFLYADQYIDTILNGNRDIKNINDHFLDMIFYISDYIKPIVNRDDINQLDNIFMAYIKLNIRYNYIPTLEIFSMFIGLSHNMLSLWMYGEQRNNVSNIYMVTVKRWHETCKSFVINRLTNKSGTDANLIFIAKAAYGMVETAPIQVRNDKRVLDTSELPMLGNGDNL